MGFVVIQSFEWSITVLVRKCKFVGDAKVIARSKEFAESREEISPVVRVLALESGKARLVLKNGAARKKTKKQSWLPQKDLEQSVQT